MWQMKREIIPAVEGALEVINKGSAKLVREIPGNIIIIMIIIIIIQNFTHRFKKKIDYLQIQE